LTIVEELEFRFSAYPGLNLTLEVLAGQTARVDKQAAGPRPLLEVQLVDAADSITYDAHDTDDAIKLGLVSLSEMRKVGLIDECFVFVTNHYSGLDEELIRKAVVHRLIDRQVSAVLHYNSRRLQELRFPNAAAAMESDFLIGPDPELSHMKQELEAFLYRHVYRHPRLMEIRQRAQTRLKEMYQRFCDEPDWFPKKYRQRAERIGVNRMAIEYIAGMTDDYCEQVYGRMFRVA
jgi:dGTPase